MSIRNRLEYLEQFSKAAGNTNADWQSDALKLALDIRKFEIELYWKRATYFWAFIAAAFVGYFALQGRPDTGSSFSMIVVACLGLIFSVTWVLANRGSKYWQLNWERHVDVLEDEVTGPLYKTTLTRPPLKWWKVTDPYPFSVTKLNQLASAFVVAVWVCLLAWTIFIVSLPPAGVVFSGILVLTTIVWVRLLYRTGKPSSNVIDVDFTPRLMRNLAATSTAPQDADSSTKSK